jgi:hypothetical protein
MLPAEKDDPKDAPRTAKDGLDKICEKEKYAFFTSDPIYQFVRPKLPCDVVPVPKAYYLKAVSLVMKKGSQLKRLFDHK